MLCTGEMTQVVRRSLSGAGGMGFKADQIFPNVVNDSPPLQPCVVSGAKPWRWAPLIRDTRKHRRGKWGAGGAAAPLEIFWPPLDDFWPLRLLSWAIFGTKHASNPAKIFFRWFWAKKTLQIRWRPIFFFRKRWILGRKDTPNAVKTFFFL